MYLTLPAIDFGRFLAGSTEDRKQIASEVDHALKTIGFFYIRNYSIPQSRIDNCFDWVSQLLYLRTLYLQKSKSRRFFNLLEY
jgi:isopenicillin N synthase-like dioxygenase